MVTTARTALAALVAFGALACSAPDPDPSPLAKPHFGWHSPVTPENCTLDVMDPLGTSATPIVGHSIGEIVTAPDLAVRADGKSCPTCHAWASTISAESFCMDKVVAFEALPTVTGHGDPPSAKPKLLKDLFSAWRKAHCPD